MVDFDKKGKGKLMDYLPLQNAQRIQQIASATAGGGEINTMSSQGTGVSIYYQKQGLDLQLNAIKSENDRITISLDAGTHDVEVTLNEGNIVHNSLSGLNAGDNYEHISQAQKNALHTATNSFVTITGITNDVVADGVADTLTLSSANNKLSIVGTSATDTITFTINEGNIVHDNLSGFEANEHLLVGAIDHDSLLNYVANKHIDHTGVTITAGTGLSGGGTIAGNITIDCDITQYTNDMVDARIVVQNTDPAGTIDIAIDALIAASGHLSDPILLTEMAEQGAPAANKMVIWAEDEHGHTVLRYKEADGHMLTIGHDMHIIGRNTSGAEIAKGKLVYFNGTSTGKNPNFSLAKADALATMPAIGITMDTVANNGYTILFVNGRLTGLNTPWANGTVLYVSATEAGAYTNTFPPSPSIDQQIGIVEVNHATTGVMLVEFKQMQGRNDGTIRQTFQIGDGASGDVTLGFNGDAGNDGSIIWDVSEDKFVFNYDVTVPNLVTAGLVDGIDVSAIRSFKTITGITNNVVADNVADILTLAAVGGLTIVGNAGTDTITFTNTITQYTDNLAVTAIETADKFLKNDANDETTGNLTVANLITAGLVDGKDVSGLCTVAEALTHVQNTGLTMAANIVMGANDITLGVGQLVDGVDISVFNAGMIEQSSAFPGAPSEGDFHYDEDDDSLYRYNAEALAWVEVGVGGGKGANDFVPAIGFIGLFSGVWEDNITMLGWYACTAANAAHGVPDLERKFIRGAATSGGSGGSDNAVVVSHRHNITMRSASGAGNTINATAETGGTLYSQYSEYSGESGTDKNMPVFYELIFIMRVA